MLLLEGNVVVGGYLVHYTIIGPVHRSLRIVIARIARRQQEGSQYNGGVVSRRVIVIYYKCWLGSKIER